MSKKLHSTHITCNTINLNINYFTECLNLFITVYGYTDTQTQYKSEKVNKPKIQQNKTTLVQSPLTTIGQETRWAYSTTLPSPHDAQDNAKDKNVNDCRAYKLIIEIMLIT